MFESWISSKLTSVEEFERQIDNFITNYEDPQVVDEPLISPLAKQQSLMERQFELLNSSVIQDHRNRKQLEPLKPKLVIEKKPAVNSEQPQPPTKQQDIDQDSWNLSSAATIEWMRKKQKRMKSFENQSKLRDLKKDPMARLKTFESIKQGNLPPVSKTFNRIEAAIHSSESSLYSSRSSSIMSMAPSNPASTVSTKKRIPIALFPLSSLPRNK